MKGLFIFFHLSFFFLNFNFLIFNCSLSFLHAQETNPWSQKNNFPAGSLEKAVSFAINDKGYAGLGTDNTGFKKDFWQYDPQKDTWEQKEKFPAEARISAVSFSIGEKGYMGTGLVGSQSIQHGTNDFWEFDPQKNSWSQKANFPGEPRYGAVGFSVLNKGYIALGTNKSSFYNDLWEYNPASNQWNRKPDFPGNARADASVFIIGEDVFLLLGQKKELVPSMKDCWKYEPAKNQWKQVAGFPGSARVGALAFACKNKGYLLCGFNGILKRYQDFWEYDASADKWSQKKDVPFGSRDYIFAFVIGTSAYICTGHAQSRAFGTGFEVWKYDFPIEKNYVSKMALGGSLLLGENRIPLAAINVKMLNDKGEIIKTVTTGLFGSFLFMDLPNNIEYTIAIDINDPHWKTQKIYLVNRENETIAVLDNTNDFKFHIALQEKSKLQLLSIENKNMRMDMRGKLALSSDKKVPFANADISLIDNQQQIVQAAVSDKNGKFVFNYLPVDTTLYLIIDEGAIASLPKGTTILLMDENDSIVNRTTSINSKILLTNLPPEKNKLSKIYIEDPWMQATFGTFKEELLVIENIYFDYAKWELTPQAKAVLNKVVIVMKNNEQIFLEISAHTDSRGSTESNLILSEKRAQEAKKYIISQGIDENSITANGFGESRLLNRCKDGIDCTEEEHAKNRRMEFKLKKK